MEIRTSASEARAPKPQLAPPEAASQCRQNPLSLDSVPGGIIPVNHADEPRDGIVEL
jgi:hypothetical protein